MGQAMSVNRPSGYVDPSKAAVAAQAATHALTAFQQVRGCGAKLWFWGAKGAQAVTLVPKVSGRRRGG